ncbi:MAG: YraN family protein [Candidatus Doudnabacteria bacterium]|nr:YraN family protein [Candidatus Doudnabacteria bacterium]
MKPPTSLGAQGEEWAAQEYEKRGYVVVARNAFNAKGKRAGELDVVVRSDSRIIFVEVKTRTAGPQRFGKAEEAVTPTKQRRIIRAAQLYLLTHPEYAALRPQIDVCVVLVDPVDIRTRSVTIMENSVDDLT